jgi:hypothetical protein
MNVEKSLTFAVSSLDVLYGLAEPRAGYFTTAQASEVGVFHQQLSYLARSCSSSGSPTGSSDCGGFPLSGSRT